MVDIQLSRFTQTVFGYWMSGTLFGLVESGVADLLDDGPLSAEEIAARLGADTEMVAALCDAGVAIGLLSVGGDGGYEWSALGARFLSAESPDTLVNWVRIMARWQEGWRDVGRAVRESRQGRRKAGHALAADPAYEQDMARGMHEFAARSSAAVAEALAVDDGLLVDVGGGAGSYSIAACQRAPGLRAAVIDRPAVLEVTAETAAREGVGDRIELCDLDYLRDPFPAPATGVLFSNLLHSEPRENRLLLFRKAREALAPEGHVLVHGHFVGAGAGGVFPALQGLSSSLLWDVGGGITVASTMAELEEAGFSPEEPLSVKQSGTLVLRAGMV